MSILDISNIQKNNKVYNGNTRKYGITINNVDYIIKFPKENDMSVYCEYAASNFIRNLGVLCHEVNFALYNGMIVNMIKDFTSGLDVSLHSYKDTKQSSEDTVIGIKEYTYHDVIYLIDKHLKMSALDKLDAKKHFWTMFICDAIIGNRDRHWGNWGYLKTKDGYKFAPLYDNGAGLFPSVNRVIKQYIELESRKKFLYDRVFVFPASLFKIRKPDRAYRSNYAEMFQDLSVNDLFAEQVSVFKENIDYTKVFYTMQKVCDTMPLGIEYRRFYIEIVTLRYMCIVLRSDFHKAYELIEEALKGYV